MKFDDGMMWECLGEGRGWRFGTSRRVGEYKVSRLNKQLTRRGLQRSPSYYPRASRTTPPMARAPREKVPRELPRELLQRLFPFLASASLSQEHPAKGSILGRHTFFRSSGFLRSQAKQDILDLRSTNQNHDPFETTFLNHDPLVSLCFTQVLSAPRASAEKDRGTFFGLRRTPPAEGRAFIPKIHSDEDG